MARKEEERQKVLMPGTDYYAVLGVGKTASQEKIKARYRELAKKWHPDHNQGSKEAEDNIRKINEAYETLGDIERRATYDRESEGVKKAARLVDAAEQVFSGIGTLLRELGFGSHDRT